MSKLAILAVIAVLFGAATITNSERREFCNSPGFRIPPMGGSGCCTEDSITTRLPSSTVIRDVHATVNLNHTWLSDLEVTLYHEESQQSVLLLENSCGLRDDIHVVFRDDASEPLDCDNRDEGLAYTPVQSLAVFDGMQSDGTRWTWKISIDDESSRDIGRLDSWCVSFDVTENVTPESCRIDPDDLRSFRKIISVTHLQIMRASVSGDTSQFDEFVRLNFLYDARVEFNLGIWDGLAEYLDTNSGVIATIRSTGTVDSVIIHIGSNVVATCQLDANGRRRAVATFPSHAIYSFEEFLIEIDELRSVAFIEAEAGCWRVVSSTLDQVTREISAPSQDF